MKRDVFNTDLPLGLVGGGPLGADDLPEARQIVTDFVAADGGAAPLVQAGIRPARVIGDFDSLPKSVAAQLDPAILRHVAEQDSTDFEKALARVEAPLIIGLGFASGRLDHFLAVLSALVAFQRPCVLLGAEEVIFHCPPRFTVDLPKGAVVSLFPMLPVTGRSEGLHWPIDGLDFAPGQRVGTSNRAMGPIMLEMDGPGMIALLPRAELRPVSRALGSAPTWPVL